MDLDNSLDQPPIPALDPSLDLLAASTAKKVRRPREFSKLDADKLLSARGLPHLLSIVKQTNLKTNVFLFIQGLATMMGVYQVWGQGLFPKLTFNDFCKKTEKVCSQRRLRVFLRQNCNDDKRARMGIQDDLDDEQAQDHLLVNPWTNASDSENDEKVYVAPAEMHVDPLARSIFGDAEFVISSYPGTAIPA